MPPLTSRVAAALGVLLTGIVVLVAVPGGAAPQPREFWFHHSQILGTSLDLAVVAAHPDDAERAEQAILAEIERLRRILSTYDSASEIARLEQQRRASRCSPELIEVLRLYEQWQGRTGGALNGQMGTLIGCWKAAEMSGVEPDAASLAQMVEQIRLPGWRIDGSSVVRLTGQALNVNAIGRGYILGKAADAARCVAGVRGLLVDMGGDLAIWGDNVAADPWLVGVADPARPEENARPLAILRLDRGAVATSGSYQRYHQVGGRRYSHIFDPRTGRPADAGRSATVVAADNVTANALATSLCVLSPEESLRLIATVPGAACLLVTADGRHIRSPGWDRWEVPTPTAVETPQPVNAEGAWPKDYQVMLTLTLTAQPDAKRFRRPYVAVWIEDADGKTVRSLSVWGNSSRWQPTLSTWWKVAKNDSALVKTVSRATRAPGKYQLAWDGKDDQGKPVVQGAYIVRVEVIREHGKHVYQTGAIDCLAEPAKTTLKKTVENDDTAVEYGPREK
jgi:thiamine biosynthesis lipoprotein ApbE